MFLRSILLGGALGLLYDLLRAVRALGGQAWGCLLDGFFCLASLSLLFFFVMAGDGELRLFFLAGVLGGAVLFFCLLSRTLRPIWDFWLQIFPAPTARRTAKKLLIRGRSAVTMRAVQRYGKRNAPAEGDDGDGREEG